MEGWYYKVLGAEFGPVSMQKLIELAKSNSISADDQVRFGLKSSWRSVGSIGQLMAHLPFEPNTKSYYANPYGAVPTSTGADNRTEQNGLDQQSALTSSHLPAEDTETRWWCKIANREYGPVPLSKLIEWAHAGRLHRQDQVRFGNDPYVIANDVKGLFLDQPKPPASTTPGTAVPFPKAGDAPSVPQQKAS